MSTGLRRKLTRYTAGSVVAGLLSQAVFVVVYGLGLAGPRLASVVAWLAGAVPNYYLNRTWTWGRRGRSRAGAEVLPYAAVAVLTAVAAATTTSAADRWVAGLSVGRPVAVVLVALTFGATYGVLFVVKFVLFDRWLFRDRSRHQVPSTTRP